MLTCDKCGSKDTTGRPTQLIESGEVRLVFLSYEVEVDNVDLCYDCTVKLEEIVSNAISSFIKP